MELSFTFYYIYIKTDFRHNRISHFYDLHSTIFILKPTHSIHLLILLNDLHSTIFILKPVKAFLYFLCSLFTFYYIYIKTDITYRLHRLHFDLHSTIFILKLKMIIMEKLMIKFTFYYIYIKTDT